MTVSPTSLPGVLLVHPDVHGDQRGYFLESFHAREFARLGLPVAFVQDNQALSAQDVLRGLHYQLRYPQGKLVWVALGEVLDVAVDIRRGSPTYGRHFSTVLSDTNHHRLYIPPGFAHGYRVLSPQALFQYKCTEFYHPEDDYGVCWNDPELKVDWKTTAPVLSAKDRGLPPLDRIPDWQLPHYEEIHA